MRRWLVRVGGFLATVEVLLFLVAGSIWASGSNWTPVPSLKFKWVAVIDDATVYGVEPSGELLRRSGDSWLVVPGSPLMRFVAGSPDILIGVDTNGRVRAWSLANDGIALIDVSVSGDLIYAVDWEHRLLRRSGDSWSEVIGPSMQRVSGGNDGTTYGLGPRPAVDTNNVWAYDLVVQ